MADLGAKMTVALGGGKPPAPKPKPEKTAFKHVDNFSEANLGKKAPQPKVQKIHGQTFLT